MSLSDRLSSSTPRRQNKGCVTCKWLASLSEADQQAIKNWMDNGWSIKQLHVLCSADPENPLPVRQTAFMNHFRDCR